MTATQAILAEINSAVGSASSKAFIAAVCEGEGGILWNTLFGSGTLLPPTTDVQATPSGRVWVGSIAAFPSWGGAELSGGSITHAAGAMQFEPASYAGISQVSGRSDFTPQSQIQNCWDYANQIFSSRAGETLHAVLEAAGSELDLIPTYLISIWPGGCSNSFPQRFVGNLPLVSAVVAASVRKVPRSLAVLW